jgi:Fic family protein
MKISTEGFLPFIQESNAIEGYDYPLEHYVEGSGNFHIGNSFKVLNYLNSKLERSQGPSMVQEWLVLHSILIRDLIEDKYRGVLRPVQVYVGEHVPPRPEKLKEEITEYFKLLLRLNSLQAHYEFERIHPFVDGNGRVGRVLWLWQEVLAGRETRPFLNNYPGLTFEDKRQSYYSALSTHRKII